MRQIALVVIGFVGIVMQCGNLVFAEPEVGEEAAFSGKVILVGSKHTSDPTVRIEALDPVTHKLEEILELQAKTPIAACVSPDGRRLAFSAYVRESGNNTLRLFLVDEQRKVRPITEGASVVAWAPDSNRLVVREGEKYEWSSSILDVASGEKQKLEVPETDAVTDWPPSGELLSVMAGRPENIFEQRPGEFYPRRQIYLFDVEQRLARGPFTAPSEDCIKGRFSPSGRELAYSRRTYHTGKPVELCEVYDLETGKHRPVLNFTSLDVRLDSVPLWSRDEKQLLWQVSRDREGTTSFEFVLMQSDGSQHRVISATDLGLDYFGLMDWR